MKKTMLILSALLMLSCGSTEEKKEVITRQTVLTEQAKKETLARLKSPSTAVFIDSLFKVTTLRDSLNNPTNKFVVYTWVDAQNSYGATMRNRYMVIFQDKGGDSLSTDNYELRDFWD